MAELYVGLMSGTSMDGIDAVLVDLAKIKPQILDFRTFRYPPTLLNDLHALCTPGKNEVERLGRVDRAAAEAFAQATNKLLERNHIQPQQIQAIGSHGQTVRHHPEGQYGFSLQIGDPNTLAALTNIDVIADFRRKDIALGGQGAPLAPAFHQAMFSHAHQARAILNIGGIANLTYLPSDKSQPALGFDTGPGNTLLDAWCKQHTDRPFDDKGAWAAQGQHDPELLANMLAHPFFGQPAPKSTGRETFHLPWLKQQLEQLNRPLSAQAVQATLVALSCHSIAQEVARLGEVSQVFVCGGGAKNDFLMESLESELFDCELTTTADLDIDPDAVEALAFAWLAYAFKHRLPGNLPSVTGARRATILGGYFPAP